MPSLNLRIGGRLYSGFGLLLFFCAALAGFGVWQLTGIRDQVKMMDLQSRYTIRAGDIEIELQAIRRVILRYAFDQDEASSGTIERLAEISTTIASAVEEQGAAT